MMVIVYTTTTCDCVIQFEFHVVIQYELSLVKYGRYNHFVVNCRHVMNEGILHLSTGKGECIHS